MTLTRRIRWLSAASAICISGPALAQGAMPGDASPVSTQPDTAESAEIIVTAQRKDEPHSQSPMLSPPQCPGQSDTCSITAPHPLTWVPNVGLSPLEQMSN